MVLAFIPLLAMAQQLEVKAPFSVSQYDVISASRAKKGPDGKPCAVVRVQLPVSGVKFQGNVVSVLFSTNEYWVYLRSGTKKFRITCPDYQPIDVDVTSVEPNGLRSNICYIIVLAVPSEDAIPQLTTASDDPIIQNIVKNMVWVKGGTFTMGATPEQGSDAGDEEKPAHKVKVPGFFICKYELTQKEWTHLMGSNPSKHKGDDLPLENCTNEDAANFIKVLNEKSGLDFTFPYEAEWEYAARGGQLSKGYKYAGSNDLDSVGWYADNSSKTTHPVGLKAPNELGLYDMSGNVSEVTDNLFRIYDKKMMSMHYTVRGGSWKVGKKDCRVSSRRKSPGKTFLKTPNNFNEEVGIRLIICNNPLRREM